MVAPCVALVPGVLNGALVTLEVIEDTYQGWNGVPLVLNHPNDKTGHPISANHPHVLDDIGIGHVFNVDVDAERLRVEAWIDLAQAKKIGGDAQRVVERIENGEMVEVSTGYFAKIEEKSGVFNNIAYNENTVLIIPDHLAILPNAKGACSIADGCGVPRFMELAMNENSIATAVLNKLKAFLPGLEANMTARDKFQALNTIIGEEMKNEGVDLWGWHLMDIEDNYAIVGIGNAIKRRAFSELEDGSLQLTGEWETVQQQTTFVPVQNDGKCSCGKTLSQHAEPDDSAEDDSEHKTDVDEDDPREDGDVAVLPEGQAEDDPDTKEGDPVDTLQEFLTENQTTREELLMALNASRTERAELAKIVQENMGLSEADVQSTPTPVLRAMAARIQEAQPVEQQQQQHASGVYVGGGMPAGAPNMDTHGGLQAVPRREVLRKKGA